MGARAADDPAGRADRPEAELPTYAPALTARGALTGLQVGDDPTASLRTAFATSYRLLPARQRRLFRFLGLLEGDITAAAAATLTGTDPAAAAGALDGPAAVHLLEAAAGGRYALPALLREYALEQGRLSDPQHVRDAAARRLAGTALTGHRVPPVPLGRLNRTYERIASAADLATADPGRAGLRGQLSAAPPPSG